MCCVMPPASRSATRVSRMASSSDVLPWSTWPMTVTTGARVPMSSAFDSSPCAETSSSSKLRISISAPNSRAMSLAVSMSSVLLMVIIMRFINSLARTSLTRTSSLSARSFTVMPSASVMVRVIGGGAAGAAGMTGADGRSRLVCSGRWPGRCCPIGGRCPKGGLTPGAPGMPGRGGRPGCVTNRLRRQRPRSAEHAWRRRPRRRRIAGASGSDPGAGRPGAPTLQRRRRTRAGWRCRRRRLRRCAAERPAAASLAQRTRRLRQPCRVPRCAGGSSAARSGRRRRRGRRGCRFRSLRFRLGRRTGLFDRSRWRDRRRLFNRGGRRWRHLRGLVQLGGASGGCVGDGSASPGRRWCADVGARRRRRPREPPA